MLKLKFSKPVIKTFMNGKITVCKYYCKVLDVSTRKVKYEFTSKGIAKCSENDKVDEALGRKLADSRAKYNAYKTASCVLTHTERIFVKEKINELVGLAAFYDKMVFLKKNEIAHIKELNAEISE